MAAADSQWRPLLWVAALAFVVLFSYGLSRSAIDALLQADNGKDATKYAYALVALGVTIVVPLYSRAAGKFALGNVMAISALATAAILAALLIARGFRVPYATYVLYIWKDVYVVVLVELIWTLANAAFKSNTARWAYGFFCVAGTSGDMSGSLLSGKLAHSVGSAELLWLVVPTMAAVAIVGLKAAKACGWPHPSGKSAVHGLIGVVRNSRSIQLLLALVAVIQIVTTLIDFTYLTTTYEAAALYASVHPTFAGLAVLKIVNKSLDYSLFRTSKELLYRPLSYAEQTQGKAAVDIFGYRAAKGGASGLLVGLSGFAALITIATAIGIGLWLVLAAFLALRFTPEESTTAK